MISIREILLPFAAFMFFLFTIPTLVLIPVGIYVLIWSFKPMVRNAEKEYQEAKLADQIGTGRVPRVTRFEVEIDRDELEGYCP